MVNTTLSLVSDHKMMEQKQVEEQWDLRVKADIYTHSTAFLKLIGDPSKSKSERLHILEETKRASTCCTSVDEFQSLLSDVHVRAVQYSLLLMEPIQKQIRMTHGALVKWFDECNRAYDIHFNQNINEFGSMRFTLTESALTTLMETIRTCAIECHCAIDMSLIPTRIDSIVSMCGRICLNDGRVTEADGESRLQLLTAAASTSTASSTASSHADGSADGRCETKTTTAIENTRHHFESGSISTAQSTTTTRSSDGGGGGGWGGDREEGSGDDSSGRTEARGDDDENGRVKRPRYDGVIVIDRSLS
jgi:hypothetical protein